LKDAKVVIFSTPGCPYCKRAKETLKTEGVAYADVDVSTDTDLRAKVKAVSGRSTVPQIFIGGSSIGGFDDLSTLISAGKFRQALEGASGPALGQDLLQAVQESAKKAGSTPPSGSGSPAAELRDLAVRMSDAQKGVARTEANVGPRLLRVFTGAQAVDWLQQQGGVSRDEARAQATRLLAANLVSVASAAAPPAGGDKAPDFVDSTTTSYFFVAEAPPPQPGQALNTHYWWNGPARPATQVASEVRSLILQLYDSHLSADGRAVSYKGIAGDPRFKAYVDATAELQRVDLAPLSPPELTSFFINLYNALIIHALVVLGTRMNALQRAKFFASAKYNIGGYDYSADDMENGVLRGNRAAASNLWVVLGLHQLSGGQFKKGDPRRAKVVEKVDPRIHFALVCGAKSCPPIKLYTPETLDEGLAAAGEAFCSSEVEVDRPKREVRLSKIFKWYSVDFGSIKVERLTWLLPFLAPQARSDLQSMLGEADGGRGIRLVYKEYDWSLNDA